ncbi:pyrroline-5-carboxylate reductase [Halosquirtibacter xylanolyticus]|uniref:pyrroline-5-carboxylate reductase n=1 Tax=Halosquirtibacter xylanolyticus TaxID=3374599 RepID=UPI0037483A89|nr:pyrroline-5-carboxylate reductase [Prolixibacteraceae bacterium]
MDKIAVIGGGNLGVAVTEGILKAGMAPQSIHVTRRRVHYLKALEEKGVLVGSDNVAAITGADLIIFAVKPAQALGILEEIRPLLTKNQIFVSLVAGINLEHMENVWGIPSICFRAMPNTAIELQESITCISHQITTVENVAAIEKLFQTLGPVLIIQDDMMAAATVLGSCGIAFALRFIRAAQQGGIEIGFNAENSLKIAAQMVKGAAELVLQNGNHPEQEIDKVTTPHGITISGLNTMEHQGFSSALIQGVLTSYNKIKS